MSGYQPGQDFKNEEELKNRGGEPRGGSPRETIRIVGYTNSTIREYLPNFTIVLELNVHSYLNCLKSIKCNILASKWDRNMIQLPFESILEGDFDRIQKR